MALDLYTQEDILNVLRATHVASEGSALLALEVLNDPVLQAALDEAGTPVERRVPTEELLSIYRRGFYTALSSVALAFGLVPVTRTQQPQGSQSIVPRTASGEDNAYDLGRIDFARAETRDRRR